MKLEKLEVKSDKRGSLVEAFKLPTDGQVFYITILPKETRGGHYHLRKVEHFLVIFGSAILRSKNRETGDVFTAEVSGHKPIVATMVPNHIHDITATDQGCICLIWTNERYDAKDTDTYPEEI